MSFDFSLPRLLRSFNTKHKMEEDEMALCTKGTKDEARVRTGEKALSEMIIPLPRGEKKKKITVPQRLLRKRKGPAAI